MKNRNDILRATVEANPNIAIVKYWGNRDDKLTLPMEGSNSVTLDEQLRTRTTVMFSNKFKEDEIWINGKKLETVEELEKPMRVLNFFGDIIKLKAKIASDSIVPIAGGLAGSAAGLCAITFAITSAIGYNFSTKELSMISRLGSGSACRSVYGGFVEWRREINKESYATQIADEKYWEDFRIVIGICDSREKKVKSRTGMIKTVKSSILYPERLKYLPDILRESKGAIIQRDHKKLFEIAMRDSNNMHAVMMDTWPPMMYLDDTSKEIINKIHEFNSDDIKSGYSFDAGPNPAIFTLDKHVYNVKKILTGSGIKNIFVSKVGTKPRILNNEKDHLIDRHGNILSILGNCDSA